MIKDKTTPPILLVRRLVALQPERVLQSSPAQRSLPRFFPPIGAFFKHAPYLARLRHSIPTHIQCETVGLRLTTPTQLSNPPSPYCPLFGNKRRNECPPAPGRLLRHPGNPAALRCLLRGIARCSIGCIFPMPIAVALPMPVPIFDAQLVRDSSHNDVINVLQP